MNTPTSISEKIEKFSNKPPSSAAGGKKIYKTTFKKGHMINEFYFESEGDLPAAVEEAKDFCFRKNLKHIHTVPFVIDLKRELEYDEGDFGPPIELR